MLRRLLILIVVLILSPAIGTSIYNYGCMHRINSDNVLQEAKHAYLQRLISTKRAAISDLPAVKCGRPEEIKDYFFGIPVGTEWRTVCAYIKNETVLTSEEFSIGKCRATTNWTHVDEGYPKPLRNSGYGDLL